MSQNPASAENGAFLFQVNLGGMIDILSNHLYSSPQVFVRELLQNAVDAISAKHKQAPEVHTPDRICLMLRTDGDRPELIFSDSGTGLTEPEIHRFLAVIGQSSKHDLTSGKIQNDYIGRFGIGLLSCFLVSDEITVRTRSVRDPEHALAWCGKPDGTYTISPCDTPAETGSQIVLRPKKGAEEYFTAERLTELLQYYGLPIAVPITVQENDGTPQRVNPAFPDTDTEFARVMTLGETLFSVPLLTYIPLDSPSGLFSGVAYVLANETAPTARQTHRIYLKNILLTEDGSRLLPKWAFFLRCFLNTEQLQPTASREDLYENEALLTARQELADCITGWLRTLAGRDEQMLRRLVQIHRLAVEAVAAEDDDLFRAFFPYLRFETSFGTLAGADLLQMDMPVWYTATADEFRQVSAISRAKNVLLVNAGYTYVEQLLLRMYLLGPEISVQRMKPERLDALLGKPELDDPAAGLRLLAVCNEMLAPYDCTGSLKQFEPDEMPVLYNINEDALLLRDIRNSMEQSTAGLFMGMLQSFAEDYSTTAAAMLYLNTANPLIRRLLTLPDGEKLRCCLEILYVQALLTGGYPMRRNEMQRLNTDLLRLLDWSLN